MADRPISSKTVIVTGAGRGIGREIALAFASAGANVACVSRTVSELNAVVSMIETTTPGRGLAVVADITTPGAARTIHETVINAFGPVYAAVNNAGIDKINTLEHEKDFDSWWRVLEVNLRGPVALVHEVLPSMLSRGEGVIISIGSRNARMSIPFTTAYSASKTALLRFHHCLELETRGRGVTNFFVQPGDVATTLSHGEGVIDLDTIARVPELRKMLEATVGTCDTPATLAAELCVRLAIDKSTRVLSGRYVDAQQDISRIIRVLNGELACEEDPSDLYTLGMSILL
ncbi:hypothetical protein AJ79_07808 [Helicocarpus griseus UAMH5409]|uniref:Uncharacterized protein n=1 Tax=Helicocarpus griseus UAMH5409 TaxID=1447875 RepID=A0A2B7WZA9_9EURO|nr:hypothetical protein AJ79_07808 [Helicocarpus griseus UAMH5409]